MADYVFKLIPIDPEFKPSLETIKETKIYLKTISHNFSDIKLIHTDVIRFIDQGSNFESIGCPYCHNAVSVEWWSEAMEEASVHKFSNLFVKPPCCNRETSLNDLHYKWDAGFARFSIEFYNPIIDGAENITKKIESIVSCKFKKVIAHY